LANADAVISLRGDMVSEGVGLEIGMAKYFYKIPVVIVSQLTDLGRISHLEADHVATTLSEACMWLQKHFMRQELKAAKRKK
jgi:ribosomal protein L7Ae-like RNA K-turn-binding protein